MTHTRSNSVGTLTIKQMSSSKSKLELHLSHSGHFQIPDMKILSANAIFLFGTRLFAVWQPDFCVAFEQLATIPPTWTHFVKWKETSHCAYFPLIYSLFTLSVAFCLKVVLKQEQILLRIFLQHEPNELEFLSMFEQTELNQSEAIL